MSEHVVTFDPSGTFGAIYSDTLLPYFVAIGRKPNTERASEVEPDQDGLWWVTFRPWVPLIGGDRCGPYVTRQAALDDEIKALAIVL